VILTRDELRGLMPELLVSSESARGRTALSRWLRENGDHVGARYQSELERHYRRARKPAACGSELLLAAIKRSWPRSLR
jgi:hypothetical protein